MDIEKSIIALAEALKNTPEYHNLIAAKSVVNSNGRLKSLLDELDQKQNYLYSSHLSENEVGKLSQDIKREYDKLSQIKEVQNYFDASEAFDTLMSNTISKIAARLKA